MLMIPPYLPFRLQRYKKKSNIQNFFYKNSNARSKITYYLCSRFGIFFAIYILKTLIILKLYYNDKD